ncbi:MAG: orotidine 5'-phosphate decarboxylase, partial [Anaerolineae bacterium]|nr:orotidine 5'-phosphate decarboxylase [Anaerolineae bacterium]
MTVKSAILDKYNRRVEQVNSLLCVGLDSRIERLPERFRTETEPQFAFNRWIIEQTHPYVSAYKPNSAFYEALGEDGLRALALTLAYLREQHPDILTICDAKRADIGS